MIRAHHNKYQQAINRFRPTEDLGDLIYNLYGKVHGYHFVGTANQVTADNSLNFSVDDILETIDQIRGPLAEKRLEGEQFSEEEAINLEILDSLTEEILSHLVQEPTEPVEVKLALEQAKRVGKNK